MTLACHPVTCVPFATHPVTCAWRFCLCSCTWPVSARCATSSRTVTTPARRCSRQPTCAATRKCRRGGVPLINSIETSLPGGTTLDTRSWLWPTCWKRLAVPSASGESRSTLSRTPSKQSLFYFMSVHSNRTKKHYIAPPPPPPQKKKKKKKKIIIIKIKEITVILTYPQDYEQSVSVNSVANSHCFILCLFTATGLKKTHISPPLTPPPPQRKLQLY